MSLKRIEIWGDTVAPKNLLFSIVIIVFTTMTAHLIAPKDYPTMGLFFGLIGAILGFLITVKLYKPKRIIKEEQEDA